MNVGNLFNGLQISVGSDDDEDSLIKTIGSDIYFYATITPKTALDLISSLQQVITKNLYIYSMERMPIPPPIRLHIHSDGGSLDSSFAIVDTIQYSPCPIVTIGEGTCKSGGSLILIAGHERWAMPNVSVLIHQLRAVSQGTHSQLQDESYNLEKYQARLEKFYVKQSKMSHSQLKQIILREKELSAKECLKLGIVDKILE